VNTLKVKSTVLVSSPGQTAALTGVNSLTTTLRATDATSGQMIASIKVIGKITRCTEGATSFGPMAEPTKELTLTIEKKVRAHSRGPTIVSTSELG